MNRLKGGFMQEFSTLSPEQAFQLCAHVVEQITGGLVVGTKGLQALVGHLL
jgi:hypothetical protein